MDRRTLIDLKAENNRLSKHRDRLIAELNSPKEHWLWKAWGLFLIFGVGMLFGANCL